MALLERVGQHTPDAVLLEARAAAKRAGNSTIPPVAPKPPAG